MNNEYKTSYKVTDKALVSLSVYNVGFQKCEPDHQWGPGIRDHYLIHYIISGKGIYHINGESHSLCAGDCFLVYPNTEVTYYADASEPWEYAWIGFAGSDASIILQATDFQKSTPFLRNLSYGDILLTQLKTIYDASGNGFENAVEMTGHLYTLLSTFMKAADSNTSVSTSQSYVQKGIEYISSNYSYPITIEDIASYVGVSRSHLFRSFQSTLSCSPKEYLTNFRIKQACYLLEHSNLSVMAIANSVGFENSLYFSKAFHKVIGNSPTEYRNKQ